MSECRSRSRTTVIGLSPPQRPWRRWRELNPRPGFCSSPKAVPSRFGACHPIRESAGQTAFRRDGRLHARGAALHVSHRHWLSGRPASAALGSRLRSRVCRSTPPKSAQGPADHDKTGASRLPWTDSTPGTSAAPGYGPGADFRPPPRTEPTASTAANRPLGIGVSCGRLEFLQTTRQPDGPGCPLRVPGPLRVTTVTPSGQDRVWT